MLWQFKCSSSTETNNMLFTCSFNKTEKNSHIEGTSTACLRRVIWSSCFARSFCKKTKGFKKINTESSKHTKMCHCCCRGCGATPPFNVMHRLKAAQPQVMETSAATNEKELISGHPFPSCQSLCFTIHHHQQPWKHTRGRTILILRVSDQRSPSFPGLSNC